MTSTQPQQHEAQALMGQIDALLDHSFFGFAMQGDMAASESATAQAALALHAARCGGLSSTQLQDAVICRNELLHAIRSGLSLRAALRQARMQEPSHAAFKRLQSASLGMLGAA